MQLDNYVFAMQDSQLLDINVYAKELHLIVIAIVVLIDPTPIITMEYADAMMDTLSLEHNAYQTKMMETILQVTATLEHSLTPNKRSVCHVPTAVLNAEIATHASDALLIST